MLKNKETSKYKTRTTRPNKTKRKYRVLHELSSYQVVNIFAVLVVCIFGVWFFTNRNSQTIYINDRPFAVIKNIEITDDELNALVVAKLSEQANSGIKIQDKLSVSETHSYDNNFETLEYILVELCKVISYTQESGSIYVNGEDMAVMGSVGDADSLLNEIMERYISDDAAVIEKSFTDSVEVRNEFVYKNEIMSKEKVKSILTHKMIVEQPYHVVKGDNWWNIAYKFGMNLNELFELNTNITSISLLRAGEDIKLMVYEPFLSVRVVERVNYSDLTAEQVRLIKNELIPGSDIAGLKADIVKINGIPREVELVR